MRIELIKQIAVTYELCGGAQMSEGAAEVLIGMLEEYPEDAVLKALVRCTREVKGHLAPSDIIQRIDDGRPGPDQAWGMVPKSEDDDIEVEEPVVEDEPILDDAPPEMEQFMADGTEGDQGVYHEESGGVWSPDMVEKRTASEAKSAVEMLKDLKELKDSGAITEEEFEVSKRRLLRKI